MQRRSPSRVLWKFAKRRLRPALNSFLARFSIFGDPVVFDKEQFPFIGAVECDWKLIRRELDEQLAHFRSEGKLLEAQRLEQRTNFDIEMMLEIGTCPGIENYSLYTSGRLTGERPACLTGLT